MFQFTINSLLLGALLINCVQSNSTPTDQLEQKKATEYPKWIEHSGTIDDKNAVNIGELGNHYPIICRFATSNGLIPGVVNATEGICTGTWNGAVLTSSNYEYLSGPLARLDWAEVSRGTVPTGAIIGGITSNDEKLYIIRVAKAKNSDIFYGGKIVKGSQGTVYKEGQEYSTSIYEVLCLQTIII